jgi:hypothetical protein
MKRMLLIALPLIVLASVSMAAVAPGITISGVIPSTTTYGGPAYTAHLAPSASISYSGGSLSVMYITNYTPLDGSAEQLVADTTGTRLTSSSSYDGSKVRLTIAGIDSVANYQRVLQSV